MERRRGAAPLLLLAVLAAGTSLAAAVKPAKEPPSVDALETAKAAIRLKDFGKAAAELDRFAKKGDADAQYLLGSLCLSGLGVPVDTARARALFEEAARQKHARAAYSLATLLATAEPRDPIAAQRWLEEARRLGLTAAEETAQRKSLPLQFQPPI